MHGQSDQLRLLRPAEQRAALDRFAGAEHEKLLATYREAYGRVAARRSTTWPTGGATRASGSQEADLLRLGLDEITRVDPQPGEDDDAARRGAAARARRGPADRGRSWPHQALAGGGEAADDAAGRRRLLLGTARRTLEAQAGRRPGAGRAGRPGSRRRPRWSATSSAELSALPGRAGRRPGPARRRSTSGGPRCAR